MKPLEGQPSGTPIFRKPTPPPSPPAASAARVSRATAATIRPESRPASSPAVSQGFVAVLGAIGALLLLLLGGWAVLALCILLGLIPALVARNKGRNFVTWWIYGAFLFIVALPHALLMKPDVQAVELRQTAEGMKKCRFCAEMIKADAAVCRYCGREIAIEEIKR